MCALYAFLVLLALLAICTRAATKLTILQERDTMYINQTQKIAVVPNGAVDADSFRVEANGVISIELVPNELAVIVTPTAVGVANVLFFINNSVGVELSAEAIVNVEDFPATELTVVYEEPVDA